MGLARLIPGRLADWSAWGKPARERGLVLRGWVGQRVANGLGGLDRSIRRRCRRIEQWIVRAQAEDVTQAGSGLAHQRAIAIEAVSKATLVLQPPDEFV